MDSALSGRPARRLPLVLALLGFLLIDLVFVNSLPGVELFPGFGNRLSGWFLPFFAAGGLLIAAGMLQARRIAEDSPAAAGVGRAFKGIFLLNVYLTITLAVVVARLLLPFIDEQRIFRDTELYVQTAEIPLSDSQFWQAERSFTLPLVYKLLGIHTQNYEKRLALDRVGDFQSALAAASWLVLGLSLAANLRSRWLRPAAFGLAAFFGLSLDLVLWDRILLTESVSNSLFVLWVAGWMLAAQAWRDYRRVHPGLRALLLAGLLAIAILYAFTRDTNAYLVLFTAGLLLAGLLLPVVRRHPWLPAYVCLLAGLALVYLANSATVAQGRRWQVPFYDLLARRLLVEPPARAYFEARGLPVDADVLSLSSLEPWQYQAAIRSEPRFAPLKAWIDAQGRKTYLKYLLSRPVDSLARPLPDLDELVSPDSSEYRNPLIAIPAWERWLTWLLYPRSTPFVLSALGLLAAALLALAMRGRRQPAWVVPLALLAAAYPLMFLIWHGGTLELERHAIQLAVQLRLAGWTMALLLADSLVAAIHRPAVSA